MSDTALELVCPNCAATDLCGLGQMQARLRSIGQLRRDVQPQPQMLIELFRQCSRQLACHECDHVGLTTREPREEDWGTARCCERCHARIPNERLELFPDARRCAACEAAGDKAERDFCPRCGNEMQIRQSRSGVTRYSMVCPSCGPQR